MPIPAFAPVVRLLSEFELETERLGEAAGVVVVVVEDDCVAKDCVVKDGVEVIEVEVAVVGYLMFQPTMAIAPTVELEVMVVVAIDHEVESSLAVDP